MNLFSIGSAGGEALSEPHSHKRKPHSCVGVGRVEGLPETHESSNYILLRIPIDIHPFERGLQAIYMDSHRLLHILGLSETAIEHLRQAGLVRVPLPATRPKERIDYAALQQTYARMLADGQFSNQTELARHLGVSRAWASRMLKGIIRKSR